MGEQLEQGLSLDGAVERDRIIEKEVFERLVLVKRGFVMVGIGIGIYEVE